MSTRLRPSLTSPALVAALSLLCPLTTAHALTGDAPVRFSPESRDVRLANAPIQARMSRTNVWKDFLDRHGDWTARWDEATRTPVRFYGEGWDVDPTALADDDRVWDIAYGILAEELALLGAGVDLTDLEPWALDRRQGITTVSFRRLYAGLPVDGARVSLRFKSDRFVMGQFESMPGIEAHLDAAPKANFPAALVAQAAIDGMGWTAANSDAPRPPTLVVLPLLGDLTADYNLAWRIDVSSTAFPSDRVVHVDADTGKLLQWEDSVRWESGTVLGEVDDRYPGNGITESPLHGVEITDDARSYRAGADGSFTTDEALPANLSFNAGSNSILVENARGALATFSTTLTEDGGLVVAYPTDVTDDEAQERYTRAQLDVHVAAHAVRARSVEIDPNFGWASRRATAEVNIADGGCNAYYNGDIHFLSQSGDCNNTGRVADVVYHEYGHGFHRWSMIEGVGQFDGALSEGLGDYMAATMTGDPGTARGFFRNSTRPLRDIAPNHVWPNDVGEIHYTGIIIAGALWDLRSALSQELGDEAGVALADQFFLAVAARATDIPTSYEEVLLADDDNGNLADGTPNKCLIDEEMGRHGLGPAAPGQPLFALDHVAPEAQPDAGITLQISADLARPDCTNGDLDRVRVLYTYDGDADLDDFESVEVGGNNSGAYDVTLPPAPDATFVRYRLEVLDTNGDVVGSEPQGSISDPWFGLWVGTHETVFFADFEDDDDDFTSELVDGDTEREGANDWGWGMPQGDAGDPDMAHSGNNVWGNDITPGDNWNGAYQPNVHNVLRSPAIDVEGATEVFVQFRRWLTIEDGYFDTASVRVNGRTIWSQLAGSTEDEAGNHHQDLHWALRSYDVSDLIDATGSIRVEWELITDGGLQLGGWNLDDVRVVAKFAETETPVDGGPFAAGSGCEECNATGGATPSSAWMLLGVLSVAGISRRRRA